MPWYDYDCELCGYEFTEVLPMDDRKIPVENGCPECGEDSVRQLLGNVMMADPANIGASGRRPDNSYSEVVAKINEKNNIKGAHEKIRAKKGRGK